MPNYDVPFGYDFDFARKCREDEEEMHRWFYAGTGMTTLPHSRMRLTWDEPPLTWWQKLRERLRA